MINESCSIHVNEKHHLLLHEQIEIEIKRTTIDYVEKLDDKNNLILTHSLQFGFPRKTTSTYKFSCVFALDKYTH